MGSGSDKNSYGSTTLLILLVKYQFYTDSGIINLNLKKLKINKLKGLIRFLKGSVALLLAKQFSPSLSQAKFLYCTCACMPPQGKLFEEIILN
jgi:hypothetical protein